MSNHKPRNANSHEKLEETRNKIPARASGGTTVLQTPWFRLLWLLISRTRRTKASILASKFLIIYHDSSRKLIHLYFQLGYNRGSKLTSTEQLTVTKTIHSWNINEWDLRMVQVEGNQCWPRAYCDPGTALGTCSIISFNSLHSNLIKQAPLMSMWGSAGKI